MSKCYKYTDEKYEVLLKIPYLLKIKERMYI